MFLWGKRYVYKGNYIEGNPAFEPEYVTDMKKVMAYGVMSMPALVVNEKVVSMGKVP